MVQSRQWILAKKADSLPTYSGSNPNFELKTVDLPDPQPGELLLQPVYLSNDPAQRGWISSEAKDERMYVPTVRVGSPMHARGLARVRRESRGTTFKEGDWVFANCGWSEYVVVKEDAVQAAPELPNGLSRTTWLGALGGTGMTAYYGLIKIAECTKEDKVVVVSGAAGATGSVVVQLAKKYVGVQKVIGIAGSEEKCRWAEKIGADVCLNYKDGDFAEKLARETPGPDGFANVYFDNVGGEILDLMLTRMARHGRIAACGAIADYNHSKDRTTGIKNWFEVIAMRIQIRGFIVLDFMKQMPEAREVLMQMLKEGKLEIEGSEHVVKGSFEEIPKIWLQLFEGGNRGKLITALE